MIPANVTVLLSGSGTTLQNLIDRQADGSLPIRIVRVISSRGSAFGLTRARNAGIPTSTVVRKEFADPQAFSRAIFETVRADGSGLVLLAGWLRLLKIPPDFESKVLNIHPSLLPAFGGQGMYGHRVHEAVLARGAKVSGCTVHFVDDQFDHGPIVVQRSVAIPEGCTPDDLAKLVFAEETIAYPEAIAAFVGGRLTVRDGCVRVAARP